MPRIIVKQPNGLYAIFSTVVDCFTVYDATAEDIKNEFIERAVKSISADVGRTIQDIESDKPQRRHKTYAECLKTIKFVHGESWEEMLEKEKINEQNQNPI